MKSQYLSIGVPEERVTSYAEVWIEIEDDTSPAHQYCVTSYAEVWIEMTFQYAGCRLLMSPPTRRCGLKSFIYKFLHRICLSPPTRR